MKTSFVESARPTFLSLALVMLLADPIAEAADGECSASREYGFVCGPRNPEDLAQIPGTKWIISSGMAAGAPI